LLTTDQRIRYQQNLTGRKIAIVVLSGSTKWSRVRLHLDRIVATVEAARPGTYAEVPIPISNCPLDIGVWGIVFLLNSAP
jgi:hypothetical protein